MEEQIADYLRGRGEDIEQDLKDGTPLDSILKEFFLSEKCVNIDYSKKLLTLDFDIFNHQPDETSNPKNPPNTPNPPGAITTPSIKPNPITFDIKKQSVDLQILNQYIHHLL